MCHVAYSTSDYGSRKHSFRYYVIVIFFNALVVIFSALLFLSSLGGWADGTEWLQESGLAENLLLIIILNLLLEVLIDGLALSLLSAYYIQFYAAEIGLLAVSFFYPIFPGEMDLALLGLTLGLAHVASIFTE